MTTENKYIVIEGNIGAGKSTLSTKLSNEMNARLILEQFSDNPFLPKFYKNPERYNFTLELSFLAARYKQLQNEWSDSNLYNPLVIADYYFIKSLIFAQGTLDVDEYTLYQEIFNITYKALPKPDLYVFLHQKPEKLLNHIQKRGRDYESNISIAYLQTIQENYFAYFKTIKEYPILIVDCNKLDFVENTTDYNLLKDLILEQKHAKGISTIQP